MPFPVGGGLRRRIDTVRGAPQGNQVGKFPVQPVGEVARGGASETPSWPTQTTRRTGRSPRELLREGQETLQVATLGIEGDLGLARDFDHEVEGRW